MWDSNCQTIDVETKAYSRLMNDDELTTHLDKSVKTMLEKVLQYYSTQTKENNANDLLKLLQNSKAPEKVEQPQNNNEPEISIEVPKID